MNVSKMQAYTKAKDNLRYAESWADLIGKPYHGGGGGVGKVINVTVKAEVYHQAYDGATNYHGAPRELLTELALVIKGKSSALIAEAIESLKAEVKKAAIEAESELRSVAADAGLSLSQATTPPPSL